jgi:16S rRNA (guanine966-N2)-methyltransferase
MTARRRPAKQPPTASSSLRIIGGRWRGRKLLFNAAEGLRPTGDRVRETLFNWLAAEVPDARCADLFSGSGALGLEALSRGARHCDFVDNNAASLAQIRRHLATLDGAARASCHACSALDLLASGAGPWDIVFIDPPFALQLVEPVCALLAQSGVLAPRASIYIETAATEPEAALPADWVLYRDKTSGAVRYRVFRTTA